VLQPGRLQGRDVMLRVGLSGSSADPTWAARALREVGAIAPLPAPELVDQGRLDSVSWSTETGLTGRTPRRLTPWLLRTVVDAFGAVPTASKDASSASRNDLARLKVRLPRHSPRLSALESALDVLGTSAPGVLGHGDLWTGNLLCRGDRLTGVVDWDAWHEATAPGIDLLQLFATSWRRHLGLSLGGIWGRRPWRHPTFVTGLAHYWSRWELEPSPEYLDALGVAWWAREVTGTLTRFPGQRHDHTWMAENVERVLGQLSR
jgi:hypothetical protein